MNDRFCRADGVTERKIDDELFLVNADNQSVFHLNALGSAIWQLLKDPASIEEAATIVQRAFPDNPADDIIRDVGKLIKRLASKKLVTRMAGK